MVQSVTAAGIAGTSSTAAQNKGAAISSDFQTFLKMLTTQMQNQDPLNPIESSDYAVQLATFSGVEQQVKTNDLLQSLAAQMGMSQLVGWVGKEARVSGPVYYDGAPLTLAPEVAAGADRAVLVVQDANGNEVLRHEVAPVSGLLEFGGAAIPADGLAGGHYSFTLESHAGGARIATDGVEAYARIAEAQNTPEGMLLVLRGGAVIAASDVKALREPG